MNGEEESWGEIAARAEAEADAYEKEKTEKSPPIEEPKVEQDEKKPEPTKRRRVVEAKEKPETAPAQERQPATDAADKASRDEWVAQAEKFGFKVEDGAVTNKDKAELRITRANIQKQLNEQGAQLERLFAEKVAGLEDDLKAANFFREVLKSQDFDALAQAAGFKNFGEMSMAHVRRGTDPALSEVSRLRKELAEKDRREQQQREAYESRERQAAEERQKREYFTGLRDGLAESIDPVIAGFASDPADGPGFVSMVFKIQEEHWDGHSTISPEEAAKIAIGQIRDSYARTANKFGDRTNSETVTARQSVRRTSPRNISQEEVSAPSRVRDDDSDDIQSWASKWKDRVAF